MSKDHFYFSRNDRIVAMVLLCIIILAKVVVILLPQKTNVTVSETDSLQFIDNRSESVEINIPPKESARDSTSDRKTYPAVKKSVSKPEYRRYVSKRPPSSPVDLNLADSLTLISLPGIGPYYSSRIMSYRERLGGYVQISQIMEINGISDSLMRWFVVTDTVPFRKIQVNAATLTELRNHPYLNYYQARAIMELRHERGKIKGPEQLSLLEEFTEQDLVRLKPYLDYE